jgi:adenylate cyclase
LEHDTKTHVGDDSGLSQQCLVCGTPLHGPFSYLARLFGISRSSRNPNLCNRCNTHVETGRLIEITVLFADLASFTELTHELGADAAFEIANAFLQVSTFELVKRGAFIDKYIGDAVMAIFNVPIPAPDHSARAVAAALEILEQTEKLGARFGRTLAAGVGIASGWARVGSLGADTERNFTAVGDVVNLASRLEGKTGPGEILADAAVYRQVASECPETVVELLSLKGLGDSVPAYRLRRSSGMQPRPSLTPPAVPDKKSSFALGALVFAILGAPCAATTLLGPLAIAFGLGSIFGSSAVVFLDDWRVRFPLIAVAVLGTAANLYTIWHSSRRRRREAGEHRVAPLSRPERRRVFIIFGFAILTFLAIGFEFYAHYYVLHHSWP